MSLKGVSSATSFSRGALMGALDVHGPTINLERLLKGSLTMGAHHGSDVAEIDPAVV